MGPVRVLHVFGGLDSGGAESRTMDIYRSIDKNKVQFDFLIHTNKKGFFEDEIKKMGGRIYRVPRFSLKTILSYQIAIKDFFEFHSEYKIIHGHMLSTAFIYLSVAKNKGVPIRIAHSRSGVRAQKNLPSRIKNSTDKLSGIYATHKFAVSKFAGFGAFGRKLVETGDVKVIPNAINSKKYSYYESLRKELRKKLNLNGKLVVGHIGRFSPQKNHLFLLDIFCEIKKQKPESTLLLIGDGPMKSQVQERINELGLKDSVTLLGVRDDVKDLLQTMDVLLFPSTHEGLPGVVLEAQASGLPSVISSKITNEVKITDLVEYLSLDESINLWSKRVISAGKNTQRRNTYNEIVEAGYDIETAAKWYEEFYLETQPRTKH